MPTAAVVPSSSASTHDDQQQQQQERLRRSGLLSKQKGRRLDLLQITNSSIRSILEEQRKSLAMYSMKSMKVCREHSGSTSNSTRTKIKTDDDQQQQQQQQQQQTAILYGTLNDSGLLDDDDDDDDDDDININGDHHRRQRNSSSYQSNTTSSDVSEQVFRAPTTAPHTLDAQISLAAQDSMQVERLCQRFHQLFTTGTSSITSQDIDNTAGAGTTTNGAAVGVRQRDGRMNSSSAASFYYPALLVATASRASMIQTDTSTTIGERIGFSCLPTEERSSSSSTSYLPSVGEEQQQQQQQQTQDNESSSSLQLLEVLPGISLPLKPLQETWVGIRQGKINISTCISCQEELTFVDDLRLVVCGDCWTINPIDKLPGNNNNNEEEEEETFDPTKDFVGLGVKNSDIVAWMENGCRESFSN